MRLLLCCLVVFLCSAVVGGVTVTPTATSLYLNNPLSGLYKWYDSMEAPLPTRDTYYRWSWREIETAQGVYDYTKIDAKLAEAKDVFNGKFGFRIMVSDSYAQGKSVPDYFATAANGWACTALGNTWIPNWNGAALLTRITALFDALATRYANDSRLGFLDVGIYGNYGEWHNAEFYNAGCFPGPNGWGEATYATKQSFINLVTSRFPNKYIVINTNDYEGSCIALSGTRLGLRGDTFSDAGWTSSVGTNNQLFELYRLQYRSAPFISEFSTGPDFTKALANALEDHRTNVGNGNFPTWDYQSAAQKNALLAAAPFIGPRLRLTSATYTSPIPPYGCLQVSLTFINDGSSRVYDPYNVIIQFRSTTTGAVVWQTPSSVADIRNVLPSNDGVASWTGTNNFQLPCTIATGTYNVVLLIQDPTNYRPNFLLAIANVNGDLSYTLGQVTISTSATYNPTCPTTIPSYTQPKYPIGPGVNSWNDHPLGPVYTDFVMWGWQQELNGATGNVANTSPVYGSSGKSIAFTSTNAYGIWGAVHVCGVDRTGYTYIHFRMRAATAGAGTVFFYPYQSPWNSPPSVDLTNYGGNPTNTGWTNYNIPFSAFAGLPTKFDHLVFGAYNNGVTFYIDDISFSDTAITP